MAAVRTITSPTSTDEIETAVEEFTQAIHDAIETTVPRTSTDKRPDTMPDDTRAVIRELRRLKRRWNAARNMPNESEIRGQLQQCRELLSTLQRDRHENWCRLTEHIEENCTECWRIVKQLRGNSKAMPPLDDEAGGYVVDNEEKANIMATEFAQYHEPGRPPKQADIHIEQTVKRFLKRLERESPEFDPIRLLLGGLAHLNARVWMEFLTRPLNSSHY